MGCGASKTNHSGAIANTTVPKKFADKDVVKTLPVKPDAIPNKHPGAPVVSVPAMIATPVALKKDEKMASKAATPALAPVVAVVPPPVVIAEPVPGKQLEEMDFHHPLSNCQFYVVVVTKPEPPRQTYELNEIPVVKKPEAVTAQASFTQVSYQSVLSGSKEVEVANAASVKASHQSVAFGHKAAVSEKAESIQALHPTVPTEHASQLEHELPTHADSHKMAEIGTTEAEKVAMSNEASHQHEEAHAVVATTHDEGQEHEVAAPNIKVPEQQEAIKHEEVQNQEMTGPNSHELKAAETEKTQEAEAEVPNPVEVHEAKTKAEAPETVVAQAEAEEQESTVNEVDKKEAEPAEVETTKQADASQEASDTNHKAPEESNEIEPHDAPAHDEHTKVEHADKVHNAEHTEEPKETESQHGEVH
ncbi:hypothetical protein BC830DRAFT_470698 [Chytriomyces sp. MP71]|nr:hypothetical protein BC830DRAFT_470698 [Chytriomyces sp. MP71]